MAQQTSSPAQPTIGAGQRAFPSHPQASLYFASESAEGARSRLALNLTRGEGPALLIGAAGCGKTMLLEVLAAELAQSLNAQSLNVVRLASTQLCTRRALLQAILFGLGQEYRDREEGELRLSLVQYIEGRDESRPPIALLVDEAQSLPVRLLEELRLLTNISVEGEPRLRLLLAGCASLDELFSSPELDAFSQRIATRSYLSPLNREETAQYVRSHVAAAGGDPDNLFHDNAYESIFQASDGLPRLVNQVCDRALVLAVENDESTITAAAIQTAWSDLHQLPAPWHVPEQSTLAARPTEVLESPPNSAGSVVEFGFLDDELEDLPQQDEVNVSQDKIELGAWNADEGLSQASLHVTTSVEEGEAEEGACAAGCTGCACQHEEHQSEETSEEPEIVAYAFPTSGEDHVDQELPEEDTTLDQEERPLSAFVTKKAAANEDDALLSESLAHDPFEESFDEEEILLDRCQGLEAVIPPGSATVTNRQDMSFGHMFEALTPAVENLLEDVRSLIEEPPLGSGFSLVSDTRHNAPSEPSLEQLTEPAIEERSLGNMAPENAASVFESPLEASSTGDADLLIVEEDEVADQLIHTVAPQDYSQLFAGLREG